MGVTAVYFSPTGNTKKSVEAMAAALDPGYETVDLTLPSDTEISRQLGLNIYHFRRYTAALEKIYRRKP